VTLDPELRQRLQSLVRVVRKECLHLSTTDRRLFDEPFTPERARRLEAEPDLSERVEAFGGRFGRLQDTVGDKLLPLYLRAVGERAGVAMDNLDRAERLGLIDSAEQWIVLRKLRNQMVHDYIEDPVVFASALQTGHESVPILISAAEAMINEIEQRGWLQ